MKKFPQDFPEIPEIEELDIDALYAIDEYQQGSMPFDDLKALVGPEAANTIQRQLSGANRTDSLFDDPEDL